MKRRYSLIRTPRLATIRSLFWCWMIIESGLISCTAQRLTLEPGYPAGSISAGRLAVILDPTRPDIQIGPYQGDPIEDVYIGFFRQTFPVLAKKLVTLDNLFFTDFAASLPAGGSASSLPRLRMPESGSRIISDSVDYVLIIEDFRMYRSQPVSGRYSQNRGADGAPSVKINETSGNELLVYEMTIVFWDNRRGKLMAYGPVLLRQPLAGAITEESWHDALLEITSRIFDRGPFQKRS